MLKTAVESEIQVVAFNKELDGFRSNERFHVSNLVEVTVLAPYLVLARLICPDDCVHSLSLFRQCADVCERRRRRRIDAVIDYPVAMRTVELHHEIYRVDMPARPRPPACLAAQCPRPRAVRRPTARDRDREGHLPLPTQLAHSLTFHARYIRDRIDNCQRMLPFGSVAVGRSVGRGLWCWASFVRRPVQHEEMKWR